MNYRKVVKHLIDAKANPTLETDQWVSAFRRAVHYARKVDRLYWSMVLDLAYKPAETEQEIEQYSRALLYAAIFKETEVVVHLLAMGADPERNIALTKPYEGYTALHFAYIADDAGMAMYLLAAGADPNRKNNAGQSFNDLMQSGKSKQGRYGRCVVNFAKQPNERRVELAAGFLATLPNYLAIKRVRRPKNPAPVNLQILLAAASKKLEKMLFIIMDGLGLISREEVEECVKLKAEKHYEKVKPTMNRFFEKHAPKDKKPQEKIEETAASKFMIVGS